MIKVLVVDDSATVRRILTEELTKDRGIEVVGAAPDPYVARDMILSKEPDVMTLDLEMPRMDGLTFLKKTMKYHPMPVIVVSSMTPSGSDMALASLELGAFDVVCKPGPAYSLGDLGALLVEKVKAGAEADVGKLLLSRSVDLSGLMPVTLTRTTNKIVAIGASTGGTEAIKQVLQRFPLNCPPTLIVQHMPEHFTQGFAKRLNEVARPEVRQAADGDLVRAGLVLLAPGNKHMVLRRDGAKYFVRVKDGPHVHFQRPSVEVLFRSVAQFAGKDAVGVILTGMGADGATALLEMRGAGAHTVAQDEKTSVVYGMPKAAVAVGAVEHILPLGDIAVKIMELVS